MPATGEAAALPIIQRVRYLLLDFDGPVCRVFAGFPAPEVAARLRQALSAHCAVPRDWLAGERDPHEVLKASLAFGPEVAARAHDELMRLETRAVGSAVPTAYAREVITAVKERGDSVGIVSNNAASAVTAYLAAHGLTGQVDCIAARNGPDPTLMKPHPYLVTQAMTALRAEREHCALVGDSVSDVIAAHRADITGIGYANKERKAE